MFEIERKTFSFPDVPNQKLIAYVRKDTDDFPMVKAGNHYHFQDLKYKRGDVVIDIGAHIGGEVLWFIARREECYYVAFEPVPENVKLLKKNIEANIIETFPFVHIFPFLLGDKTKMERVYYGDLKYPKWGKKYHFRGNIEKPFRGKKYKYVKMLTLDYLFRKYGLNKCKLLRLEPENNVEVAILKAASPETLKRIEWIWGSNPKKKAILEATRGYFVEVKCPISGLYRFHNKKYV